MCHDDEAGVIGLQPSTRFNQYRLALMHKPGTQRRYRYRLYPHPHQKTDLARVFGIMTFSHMSSGQGDA